MEHKEYNGWTNYETWAVKLWLDNDEGTYNLQKEWLKKAKKESKHEYWTQEQTTTFTLADIIKDFVAEGNPLEDEASMYSDLMSAALSEVNWQEIAKAIVEDAALPVS